MCQTQFQGIPDVSVLIGDVPADLGAEAVKGHRFEASPNRLLLSTDFIANYLVEDGRSIRIMPKPAALATDICNLLFGWATGGLLMQRGTLALHASTVATPTGAVAFCGESGVGKSTLVTQLMARNFPVIDDNIAALDFSSGQVMVQPGLGSVKLTQESLDMLQTPAAGLEFLSPHKAKYMLPVAPTAICPAPVPLRKIYVLRRAEAPSRRTLTPAEKLDQLQRHTFVVRFASGLGCIPTLFKQWLHLGRNVLIEELAVPMDRSAQQWADDMAGALVAT